MHENLLPPQPCKKVRRLTDYIYPSTTATVRSKRSWVLSRLGLGFVYRYPFRNLSRLLPGYYQGRRQGWSQRKNLAFQKNMLDRTWGIHREEYQGKSKLKKSPLVVKGPFCSPAFPTLIVPSSTQITKVGLTTKVKLNISCIT